MKTYNTFLKFKTDDQEIELCSIADLMNSGVPIDVETGNDLTLASDQLFQASGDPWVQDENHPLNQTKHP